MLNELLSEEVPFPAVGISEIWMKVVTHRMRPKAYAASATDPIGNRLMSLIRTGWSQDPALRVTFQALAADLNQLLTASVEIARNGSRAPVGSKGDASPLASSTPEAAITALAEWLTSSCGLLTDDSASLAHTLVTTKSITSVQLLSDVVLRDADVLTHDLKVPTVHDIQIKKALQQMKGVKMQLSDLSVEQVCLLLDSQNLHSSIKPVVIENEISGNDDSASAVNALQLSALYIRCRDHPGHKLRLGGAPDGSGHQDPPGPGAVQADRCLEDLGSPGLVPEPAGGPPRPSCSGKYVRSTTCH
jgi:hypothetical protein